MTMNNFRVGLAGVSAALAFPAWGSELAYTFMDFQALDVTTHAVGTQTPVPGQTVNITTRDGDGVAVAGSLAAGKRFYLGGAYRSSIVHLDGKVTSPLTSVAVANTFDLTSTRLAFGYLHPIGEKADLIAEISYDSVTYDFGSLAGENFDVRKSGAGAQVGFRWNPVRALEIYGFGRHLPAGKPKLSALELEPDTIVNAGLRWYFFQGLGVGIDFESGDVKTTTISMRFNFGNLPW